jgi:hypothetical protein
MKSGLVTVEEVCRATGDDPRAVVDFFVDAEKARLVTTKSALQRNETAPPMERLPLRDADGNEFGRVVASIPEDMFYHLMDRPDLDPNWTKTADGVREVVKDVLKSNPACRVKTVSGKTMVGWRAPENEKRKANFSKANLNGLQLAT